MTLTRRQVLRTAVAAGASATGLGLGLYAWQWEPHWLEFVHLDLPVRALPSSLIGARLVQLSDLHVGPNVADAYLTDVFRQVAALAPDIVAYTGDLSSFEAQHYFAHVERMYAAPPRGRLATVGITGNHEYGPDWSHPEIANRLVGIAEAGGIRMLRNQIADVEGLQIVGLDDLWAKRFDVAATLAAFDPSRAALALSLQPRHRGPGWLVQFPRLDSVGPHARRPGEAAVSAPAHRAGEEPALHGGRVRPAGQPHAVYQPRRGTSVPGAVQRAAGSDGVHAAARVGGRVVSPPRDGRQAVGGGAVVTAPFRVRYTPQQCEQSARPPCAGLAPLGCSCSVSA